MAWSTLLTGLSPNDLVNKGGKNAKSYFPDPVAFDIEATNYKNEEKEIACGIVYAWCVSWYDETGYNVSYGRTIKGFKKWIDGIVSDIDLWSRQNGLDERPLLVIYIHNFSYEFQFLRKIFDWSDVFLTDIRKPLYARYKCIEFRCSYLLSNMSLKNFLKNEECTFKKLDYTYTEERYPWDPLTPETRAYLAADTAGLLEAVRHLLDKEGFTVASVPLTSTGFVRREVKRCQSGPVRGHVKKLAAISPALYTALKSAFVGGNTHASRYYADRLLEDVTCYDITSSYPYVQLCGRFPVMPFRRRTYKLDALVMDPKYAYLLKVRIYKIAQKSAFDGMPTISLSKCIDIEHYESDNGRVTSAETMTLWVTDIEWRVINYHYIYKDMEILDCYYSLYGPLPDCIKSVIFEYFENKCKLKESDPYLYRKSKSKLNAIYGMSAMDIGKVNFEYYDNDYQEKNQSLAERLAEAVSGQPAEPYSWGVWTTAQARANLDEVIRLAGDDFIYCDTDSVYVQDPLDLSAINDRIKKAADPYKVVYNGKTYYIGTWQLDKQCKQFITYGAKKYCYTDDSGTHTVTAGVHKSAGVKDIRDYQLGAVFENATAQAWYQDEAIEIEIDGHVLDIPSSLYIEESDYTLGITDTYRSLLYYMYGLKGEYWNE